MYFGNDLVHIFYSIVGCCALTTPSLFKPKSLYYLMKWLPFKVIGVVRGQHPTAYLSKPIRLINLPLHPCSFRYEK